MEKMKIALLIDAENIDSVYISRIYTELSLIGKVQTSRAYADWTTASVNWLGILKDYSISPIQQLHISQLKNAADIALTIDAMDLLLSGKYEAIAIASSDSDYSKLITRIKDEGLITIGFGEKKTPKILEKSYDKFYFVDTEVLENANLKNLDILKVLRETVTMQKKGKSNGWINIGIAGSQLKNRIPGFSVKDYGFPTLLKLLESYTSDIETRRKNRGAEYRIKN